MKRREAVETLVGVVAALLVPEVVRSEGTRTTIQKPVRKLSTLTYPGRRTTWTVCDGKVAIVDRFKVYAYVDGRLQLCEEIESEEGCREVRSDRPFWIKLYQQGWGTEPCVVTLEGRGLEYLRLSR
jgi:hypothetical protein